MTKKQFGLVLSLHKKLILSFSLSSALIIVVGVISYVFSSMKEVMMVTSAAVAVTMITGFFIYRSITKPLDNIKARVNDIALKNFEVEIAENKRQDELGELARSITQMKEHLREKDRLKDEFINVASHELRTPIQPIVAYIELARKGVVPPAKAFEVISAEAMRLKRLADDILDVSRIEGKRLNLKKESFSVNEVVGKIVESTKASVKNDAVIMTFRQNVHLLEQEQSHEQNQVQLGDTTDHVFADKYRIIQVITNILNNAIKFTKSGSIDVSTKLLDSESAIEISVSDTGGGIPDEIFPKLFDKFATKGVAEGTQNGTGLGLFISQSIVKEHGGSIAGLNNNKGGATFRVVLPTEQLQNNHNNGISSTRMPEKSPSVFFPLKQQLQPALETTDKAVAPKVEASEASSKIKTSTASAGFATQSQ